MNGHQVTRSVELSAADTLLLDDASPESGATPNPHLTFADLMAMDAANRTITAEMILIAQGNMERAQADGDVGAEPATWERLLRLFRQGS